MQALLRQPDTLRVEQSALEVRRLEPGRVPDVLYVDDKDHERAAGEDAEVTERAAWKGATLHVETKFGRGGKLTEVYAVDPDRHTMTITAKLEPPRGGDAIEVKSVYGKEP